MVSPIHIERGIPHLCPEEILEASMCKHITKNGFVILCVIPGKTIVLRLVVFAITLINAVILYWARLES